MFLYVFYCMDELLVIEFVLLFLVFCWNGLFLFCFRKIRFKYLNFSIVYYFLILVLSLILLRFFFDYFFVWVLDVMNMLYSWMRCRDS